MCVCVCVCVRACVRACVCACARVCVYTLLKVVSRYDLSVLSMSVMSSEKSLDRRVGGEGEGGDLYPIFYFGNFLQSPI